MITEAQDFREKPEENKNKWQVGDKQWKDEGVFLCIDMKTEFGGTRKIAYRKWNAKTKH